MFGAIGGPCFLSASADHPPLVLIARNLLRGFYWNYVAVQTGSLPLISTMVQNFAGNRIYYRDRDADGRPVAWTSDGNHLHLGTPWENPIRADETLTWADGYELGNDPGFATISDAALLPAVYYVPGVNSDAANGSLPELVWNPSIGGPGAGAMRSWGYEYTFVQVDVFLSTGIPGVSSMMYAGWIGWPATDYWGRARVAWSDPLAEVGLASPTLGAVEDEPGEEPDAAP